MEIAFTIIRVSGEDQLRGYGPDVQWFEDVLPNAPLLGLEVSEELRAVIQEPATGWDREREKFQKAVQQALELYRQGKVKAIIFPRVDRETRFLFGSLPLLAEVIRTGMDVYFAREKLKLNPDDPESVERYLSKATQAQAYVETMRVNTMKGKKRRALQDHKMPGGGRKWAFDYIPATGRYQKNEARAEWVLKCYHWLLEEGLSLEKCCRRLEQAQVPSPGWEYWMRAMGKGRTWKRKLPRADKWYAYTLRNILLDPANVGKFYAYCHQRVKRADNKKYLVPTDPSRWLLVYEEPGQAIVTEEQYQVLKLRLRLNYENSRRHAGHQYPPLRRLVFCTLCQRRMAGWTNDHSGIPYYMCNVCHNRINARKLWQQLSDEIKARLLEPERLVAGIRAQMEDGKAIAGLEAEEKRLAEKLKSWEQARDRARRLYFLNPDYSEEKFLADDQNMVAQQQKMAQELEQIRGRIVELKQKAMDEAGIRYFCEKVSHNLNDLDEVQWRLLLERMKVRVEVTPGESIKVHLALPSLTQQDGVIAYQSSARSCRTPWPAS